MTESTTPVAIDVTKAELTIALSKEGLQYQQLLQEGENLTFTKDKLVEQGASLKKLREVQKKLADKENPYTANWKAWNEARKSLVDPVSDLLKRKENEYRKLALEIEADKKREAEEKERVAGIKTAIDSFFIAQSQAIAGAKTLPELTAIEKIIGSHKANKSRYSEFLPELVAKAELLTPLIKEQKKVIRELEALKAQMTKAASQDLLEKAETVGEAKVLIEAVAAADANSLRQNAEMLRDKLGNAVVLLGSATNGKVLFVCFVSPELVKRGVNAGQIVAAAARVAGGGGGGRADMAQAGGKDPAKLAEALASARQMVEKTLL